MSGALETNPPRVWTCSWQWCPESFRHGSELLKHLHQVHFSNIRKVQKRDWDLYLRSSEGKSGATDSLFANLPPHSSSQHDFRHSPPNSCSAPETSGASQMQYPSAPTTPRPLPPLPRNLARAPSKKQHSPTPSHDSKPSPMLPPAAPSTPLVRPGPTNISPNSSSPSSASDDPRSPKRRRTSFASYAAQSSPMSTPSVASVPPSPALSNMITDAINAAGRINSRSPLSVSPRKQPVQRAHSDGKMGGAPHSGQARPIPRRTSLGTSPTPDGSRVLWQPRAPKSPVPRTGVGSGTHPAVKAHILSPGTGSVASVQAVKDALTQELGSPASPPSSAQSRIGGSLQYPSQEGTIGNSSTSESKQSPRSQHPRVSPSQSAGEAGSYYGSHAVSSLPPFVSPPTAGYQTQTSPASLAGQPETTGKSSAKPQSHSPSQSPPKHPASQAAPPPRVMPPLPRTRRAQVNNDSSIAVPTAPPPTTRVLRSRSKPPAPPPAPSVETQTQTLQLPRRTTRSRASSAAPRATSAAPGSEDAKCSKSKPPSESGKGRARSKPPSFAGLAKKGNMEWTKPGGLPAVEERPDGTHSDDEREVKPRLIPEAPVPSGSSYPPKSYATHGHNDSQSQSQNGTGHSQNGFRSGTLYLPLPRCTRAQPSPSSQQSQRPSSSSAEQPQEQPRLLPLQPSDGIDKHIKRELVEDAMDVDRGEPSGGHRRQNEAQSQNQSQSQSQSQSQKLDGDDSQSSGSGYVEGYGFDMGSLVLQTQAPYQWSQSQ